MDLRENAPMPPEQARMLNPLQLAYLGDTVWELMIRSRLLAAGLSVRHMHRDAVAAVNAGAQARALERMRPMLTEEEDDIVRRGRNAHAHHQSPKGQDPADYAAGTGLEALVGFLYATGREERLRDLFIKSQEDTDA